MSDNKIDKVNAALKWLEILFGVIFALIGAVFLIMILFLDTWHPLLGRWMSLIVAFAILGYGILRIKLTYSKYRKVE